MAYRSDLSFVTSASPRYILVDSPSTELTIQDLVDTICYWEDDPLNLSYDHLLNAAGKENLGGGVTVGITATLQNCRVGFEARGGPDFTLCSISGGNLVAVNEAGDSNINVIHSTAYVQITLTSSSSATLQELDAIQYSSYQNSVWIDTTSSNSGVAYPIGTREYPVNNTQDAVLIAHEKGFDTLSFLGNLTLDAGDTIEDLTMVGQNPTLSILTINPAANTLNSEFHDCAITGTLDGNSTVKCCNICDLNYINGFICDSVLTGVITLGGGKPANILNSHAGFDTTDTPIIDMGDSGQDLGLRAYSGSITLRNKNGTDKVFLDIISGEVILEDTVTNGTVYVRGDLRLEDNSTGNAVVDMSAVQLFETSYDGMVAIDTFIGDSGTHLYPFGTSSKPINNLADAVSIADLYNFSQYSFKGTITSTQDFTRNKFVGSSAVVNDIFVISGHTFTNCLFKLATVAGGGALVNCQFEDSIISDFTGMFAGIAQGCGIYGTITLSGNSQFFARDASFGGNPTIIDLGDTNAVASIIAQAGSVKFINAGAASVINLTLDEVNVELDSSCTGGVAFIKGTGTLVDNSTMNVSSTIKSLTTISNSVWDYSEGGDTTMYNMLNTAWNISGGNRLINNNREHFYKQSGDTAMVFVLLDEAGDSTMTNIYQRVVEYTAP